MTDRKPSAKRVGDIAVSYGRERVRLEHACRCGVILAAEYESGQDTLDELEVRADTRLRYIRQDHDKVCPAQQS